MRYISKQGGQNVEAMTFDEVVRYAVAIVGRAPGQNIPWAFSFYGYSVTHETDAQYLFTGRRAGAPDSFKFTRGDVLLIDGVGALHVVDAATLDREYRPVLNVATSDNWRHRSAGMRCASCIFFVPKPRAEPNTQEEWNRLHAADVPPSAVVLGRCRRHAPTMGGFPAVFDTDWCGDHKLDENKLGAR